MNPHPSTHLEGQQEEKGLYAVESPVHEIAHEEVVCLRGGGEGGRQQPYHCVAQGMRWTACVGPGWMFRVQPQPAHLWTVAPDLEQLHEVIKLAMDVATCRVRRWQ